MPENSAILKRPAEAALLTAAQMRAVERAAMSAGTVTGRRLMARAGGEVVRALQERWPGRGRAAVLCGPGNNGGDGFVIARGLLLRGWEVRVFLLGARDRLPPDAAHHADLWATRGAIHDAAALVGDLSGDAGGDAPDVVVDAAFGIGLSRPLEGEMRTIAGALRTTSARVVAVDVPSGLCADSGRVLGATGAPAIAADLTVTFHCAKPGHYLAEGPALCGALVVADIGL